MGIYHGIQGGVWDHLLYPLISSRGCVQAVSLFQGSLVPGRKFFFHDGKSMVRLEDQNFKSYSFKEFLLITTGSLMWALLAKC